ncbi:MAG: CARDB domain-containing protein [Chloroflexota bacterium]
MNRKSFNPLVALLALWLAVVNCNAPVAAPTEAPPETQSVDEAALTAVALTFAALTSSAPPPTEAPPAAEATAQPTACSPTVTATTNANVRSGPGTDYAVVGSLPLGGTAAVAGRNDANTWWYIDFPGGAGGHAWIAGSVTTASCLPDVVAVIAAPPLPAAPTASEDTGGEEEEEEPAPAAQPDLYISQITYSPAHPSKGDEVEVKVSVYNGGNAQAGPSTAQWWSAQNNPGAMRCSWAVESLVAHGGRVYTCTYTYNSCSTYTTFAVADATGAVDESNEGNNTREQSLPVACD